MLIRSGVIRLTVSRFCDKKLNITYVRACVFDEAKQPNSINIISICSKVHLAGLDYDDVTWPKQCCMHVG